MIDEKKKFKNERKERVQDTHNILTSIENFYKDQIHMIKDQLACEKVERRKAK